MSRRRESGRSSDSKRRLVSRAVKATAHPTREMILSELKGGPRSTLELEEVTGESRYNLYHHLGVLEDAQLVKSAMSSGRTKVFELRTPKRPGIAFLVLDGSNEKEAGALRKILEILQEETSQEIPQADEIHRAKLAFYYPWSDET